MIPGVNYVMYGNFPVITTPGVSLYVLYESLTLEENIVAVIAQDDNLKNKIINRTLCICRLFLQT